MNITTVGRIFKRKKGLYILENFVVTQVVIPVKYKSFFDKEFVGQQLNLSFDIKHVKEQVVGV
jgi:hypothetical protein